MEPDWEAIRNEYITTKTSYRKLEERYGVNYKKIQERGKAEGWIKGKKEINHNYLAKAADAVNSVKLGKAERLIQMYEFALGELEQALIDEKAARGRVTVTSCEKAMEAINKYQNGMGIVLGVNAEKMQAEIAKLRKEAETEDSTPEIVVRLEGELDDYV